MSVEVPVAAEALTTNVNVLVLTVGFVMNTAVTPAGIPEAESETLPVKPLAGRTVITLLP